MQLPICWAQMVKNPPAMQVTQVQPLGWEDALEKEMATHSSILAWIIPWTEEPCGLQTTGSQRVGHDSDITHPFAALHSILWACVESCFSVTKVSGSLWPHGLQHARLPCSPPSPRVCSDSCPLSQWCHATLSLCVPFVSCPHSRFVPCLGLS